MEHSQLYRYAKGWYQESDNKMDDLKKVLKDIYYDPSDNDILNILCMLAFKHIQGSGNPENNFMKMINRLNPKSFENKLCVKKNETFQERLIESCLSVLRFCNKDEIGYDIDKPNEKFLPLTNHSKKVLKGVSK